MEFSCKKVRSLMSLNKLLLKINLVGIAYQRTYLSTAKGLQEIDDDTGRVLRRAVCPE